MFKYFKIWQSFPRKVFKSLHSGHKGQTAFENILAKIWKISIVESLIFEKEEKIVAKGENGQYNFILLPQCIQKSSAVYACEILWHVEKG